MASTDHSWEFFSDPTAFLAEAGPLLTAEPVLGSVIASYTQRIERGGGRFGADWAELGAGFEPWWAVLRDGRGVVVSAGMRTAPFEPFPPFLLSMPDAAARDLARAVHRRGEVLGGVNGALPASRLMVEETVRLAGGGEPQVRQHTRLFEATEVEVPAAPAGELRLLRIDEAELGLAWFRAFGREADEQAGRSEGHGDGMHVTMADIEDRIGHGGLWAFEAPGGEVVHLTGVSVPAYGVSRVGPVYTPRQHRGRGVAGYVVGELTRRGLAEGTRMCLFTDQANPVSNRIYERLGYRRVVDMANVVLV